MDNKIYKQVTTRFTNINIQILRARYAIKEGDTPGGPRSREIEGVTP